MTNIQLNALAATAIGKSALRAIETLNSALGTNTSKKLGDDLKRLDANRKTIYDTLKQPPELADLIREALVSGEPLLDTPDTLTNIAAAVFNTLQVSTILEGAYEKAVRTAIGNNLPGLFKMWAKPVAEAGQAISNARAELPRVDLRDPTAAAKLTPAQFKQWAPAHAAIKTLDTVQQHIGKIYDITKVGSPPQHRKVLTVAPLTLTQLEELAGQPVLTTARDNVRRLENIDGVKISLADPSEFTKRSDAIKAELQQRADEQAQRARSARRRDTATPFNESALRALERLRTV